MTPGTYSDPRLNRKSSYGAEGEISISETRAAELVRAAQNLIEKFDHLSEIELLEDVQAEAREKIIENTLLFFVERGIAKEVAEKILQKSLLMDRIGVGFQEVFWINVKKEIKQQIRIAGPIQLKQGVPTFVCLVGPSGSGKTAVCLKIARQYKQELHRKVGIVSFPEDSTFLKTACENLSIPLVKIADEEKCRDLDLVLIDLPNTGQSEKVKSLLENKRIQTQLIIPATAKDNDAYALIDQYSFLNLSGLIFTKIDETQTLGIILNALYKSKLSVSYLTDGAQIYVADPDDLYEWILSSRFVSPPKGVSV